MLRFFGTLVIVLLAVGSLALLRPRAETPRVITLEARGMTFYVNGIADRNPVLRLRPGEQVRVVLQNREPGMTHDFAVPSLKVAIPALKNDERGEVMFRAPAWRGRHEYLCRPHALMMKGTVEIW